MQFYTTDDVVYAGFSEEEKMIIQQRAKLLDLELRLHAKNTHHAEISENEIPLNTLETGSSPLELATFFDTDVLDILKQHNNEIDRQRANSVIRLLFDSA